MDIAVVLNSTPDPFVGQSDMVMRGMAQDLNNMLAVIASGLVSIERGADPQQLSRLLAGMRRAIRNAASMSDDIAELSVGPVMTREQVSLAVALRELEDRARAILGEGVDLRTEIARDLWRVHVVPSYLRFALCNLLANAADAMPKGGWLSVSTRVTENGLTVEVGDTGAGIPTEHIARIYDPFFTTKADGAGTGLGLSVTYGIVQEHGGSLTCDSAVGQGTRFILVLPLAYAGGGEAKAN